MKQKNIDIETKKAKTSTTINIFLRVLLIFLWCIKLEQLITNQFVLTLLWIVIITLAVQCLFLPYLTIVRIKEIKKGEIYEASKY